MTEDAPLNSGKLEAKKIPKCSKCGSHPGTYRELATTAIRFDLSSNKFNESDQYINPNKVGVQQEGFYSNFEGDSVLIESELEQPEHSGKIEAECSGCGHLWILRGFKSIDELIGVHGINSGRKIR